MGTFGNKYQNSPNYFRNIVAIMAFGKEIKRLRQVHRLSAKAIADATGVDFERLRSWERKDLTPRSDDTLLLEEYFGLPIDQLAKLDRLPRVPKKGERRQLVDITKLKKTFQQNLLEKKNGNSFKISGIVSDEGVPIYDVPIDASFIERFHDQKYFEPLYHINIPKLRNCNFGAIVSGSSMYPIMKSGTIAICRVVEDLNYFDPGEMYFISTTNGFETVKYVQQSENPDELVLIPHNEKINRRTIPKNMIVKMCIVEAWLNFR